MLRRALAAAAGCTGVSAGAPASLLLAGARALSAAAPQAAPLPPAHHEELEEFRESVRQFATDLVAPHAAEIDRLNAYPPGFDFWRRAGEWGLHGEAAACTPLICAAACLPNRMTLSSLFSPHTTTQLQLPHVSAAGGQWLHPHSYACLFLHVWRRHHGACGAWRPGPGLPAALHRHGGAQPGVGVG